MSNPLPPRPYSPLHLAVTLLLPPSLPFPSPHSHYLEGDSWGWDGMVFSQEEKEDNWKQACEGGRLQQHFSAARAQRTQCKMFFPSKRKNKRRNISFAACSIVLLCFFLFFRRKEVGKRPRVCGRKQKKDWTAGLRKEWRLAGSS